MARRDDEFSDLDLRNVDLSKIDLDAFDLDDDPGGTGLRILGFIALAGLGAFLLWLPSSGFYVSSGENSWVFFVASGGAAIVGLLFARWLLAWAQAAADRYAARLDDDEPREAAPPSALRRWLTLLAAIGIGVGVVFGLSAGTSTPGGGTSQLWWLAAGGAIVGGYLLSRWLLMQQSAPLDGPDDADDRPAFVWPRWFKWVSLTVLGGLGLFAMFGQFFVTTDDQGSFEFVLGTIAFAVGIGAAVWLARRFDETEKRLREETRQKGPRGL